MNSRCPSCGHYFRFGQRKRFVTWHASRKRAACPDCGATLEWEAKSFLIFSIGFWLGVISSGIFLAVDLDPWLLGMLGLMRPLSLLDSIEYTPLTLRITVLLFQAVSFAILLSGFFKIHLVRISPQPSNGHA
jgi:hypothetical protein